MSRRIRGFTLIELIIVIVILAVLSVGVFSYIGIGANIYTDAVSRDQLTSQSRFAIERLTRELRNSLPRSQRVNATDNSRCLEYVPIFASSSYLQIPTPGFNAGADFIAVQPTENAPIPAGSKLMVYATTRNHIYNNASIRSKADPILSAGPQAGLVEISYSGTPQFFPTQSPARRYYIASQPVSWCVQGSELRRYTNYGWQTVQPSALWLAAGEAYETMAVGLSNSVSEAPFYVEEATLRRTAVVQMDFRFTSSKNEPMKLLHEVHVPNVP
ncbi:prepilin-type N-terminal cleavage/methylation domain-containing protein [Pseudidiomarina sp. WS423]|uniref:prepilin-type N-terminal cleavage/methylation domain-containing protein n=1 Tax=Pseudidiomarina sp. WS423 TaxID=3425124 RepID=UPI003D70191A